MAKRKSVLEAVHTTARGLRKAGIMREQTIVKDTTWSRSSFKDESTQGGNMVAIEPLYTIGALARHSGCSVDTIRYYERMQLMPAVPRTAGGHRLYDGRHAARLAFIHRARALGLSLKQVRDLIDGVDRHACGCSRIRSLLEERAAEVDRRLADLQKLGRRLRTLIEVCGNATGGGLPRRRDLAGGRRAGGRDAMLRGAGAYPERRGRTRTGAAHPPKDILRKLIGPCC